MLSSCYTKKKSLHSFPLPSLLVILPFRSLLPQFVPDRAEKNKESFKGESSLCLFLLSTTVWRREAGIRHNTHALSSILERGVRKEDSFLGERCNAPGIHDQQGQYLHAERRQGRRYCHTMCVPGKRGGEGRNRGSFQRRKTGLQLLGEGTMRS